MVGHAKWISLTALSLILAWQLVPAQAQSSTSDIPPAPGQYTTSDDDVDTRETEPRDDADSQPSGDVTYEFESYRYKSGADESDDEESAADASDDDESTDDAAAVDAMGQQQTETIKERFGDGKVKIEREVTQDAAGNYLNHGSWKMWDERGNLVAQGQYRYGDRTGTWVRWYRSVGKVPLLRTAPYKEFAGPFVSQATFQNGKLNGYWTIYDGKLRKISQWRFVDGKRHGLSIWWHPGGRKMREIQFRDGDIDGHLVEWSPEGAAVTKETYQAGRKLAQKTSHYKDGKVKKSQGMYLFAKDAEKTPDDWWNCKLVATAKAGLDERHGPSTRWHPSGQRQLEGTYEHDLQVGLFTWWHSNGQKALEGRYDQGKQDGAWTWWYGNGQKSIQGGYAKGNPTGRWTWWGEDGRVAQSADLSGSEGVVIQTPSVKQKPNVLPQVRRPTPRRTTRR